MLVGWYNKWNTRTKSSIVGQTYMDIRIGISIITHSSNISFSLLQRNNNKIPFLFVHFWFGYPLLPLTFLHRSNFTLSLPFHFFLSLSLFFFLITQLENLQYVTFYFFSFFLQNKTKTTDRQINQKKNIQQMHHFLLTWTLFFFAHPHWPHTRILTNNFLLLSSNLFLIHLFFLY